MKITLSHEIVQAIEALPAEARLEVYSLVFNYFFHGFIPANPSPVAQSVFMLVRPALDKQLAKSAKKPEPAAADKTEQNIETVLAPNDSSRLVSNIVRMAENINATITNPRRLFMFFSAIGLFNKLRHKDLSSWIAEAQNTIANFIRGGGLNSNNP